MSLTEQIHPRRVCIRDLPFVMKESELRTLFSNAGKVVKCTVSIQPNTDISKGFGFVEFEQESEATKAIAMFNGQEIGGRQLIVTPASMHRPKPHIGRAPYGPPTEI